MNEPPRTLLGRLLAEDGRSTELFKPGDCPAPFHAEIAKLRAGLPELGELADLT